MNRKDRRAAKAEDRKMAKHANALSARIMRLASAFYRGDEELFDELAPDLIEARAFDDILEDSVGMIQSQLPGFDIGEFKRALIEEASSLLIDHKGESYSVTMFAIPITGTLKDVYSLPATDRFDKFAQTLISSGVCNENSAIALLPDLIDPVSSSLLMPGQISAITKIGFHLGFGSAGGLAASVKDIVGYETDFEPTATGTRLIIGIEVNKFDESSDEFPTCAIYNTDDDAFDRWQDMVEDILPGDVVVGDPDQFSAANTEVAMSRIISALGSEATALGFDPDKPYDVIELHQDAETTWVSAMAGGKRIGPIDVPTLLLLSDRELAADWLGDLAVEVRSQTEASGPDATVN
jgi:hypothetical protein